MPRPRNLEPREKVGIVLPTSVLVEVDLLLHDPVRGKAKFGARSALITGLLREWVRAKKETVHVRTEHKSDGSPVLILGGAGLAEPEQPDERAAPDGNTNAPGEAASE